MIDSFLPTIALEEVITLSQIFKRERWGFFSFCRAPALSKSIQRVSNVAMSTIRNHKALIKVNFCTQKQTCDPYKNSRNKASTQRDVGKVCCLHLRRDVRRAS